MRLRLLAVSKMALAASLVVAVLIQDVHGQQIVGYNNGDYFSYFTVWANVVAALVLVFSAYVTWHRKRSRTVDYLRGAAVMYMILTGLGYSFVSIARTMTLIPWNLVLIPWANDIIHFIGPALVICDWLADPPNRRLRFRPTLYWLTLPFFYAIFSLIRGNMTSWYPYPFLDVSLVGYGEAITASGGILGLILAASFMVTHLTPVRPNSKH